MLKYSPYIVVAVILALALWILIRHIIRLIKGKSTCGSCSDSSDNCSSGCAGCSYAGRCNTYNTGNDQKTAGNDKQDTVD